MDGNERQSLPTIEARVGKPRRLGIMGGTFDPIHYGHLVTAEQAREALDLDLVLFMPSGNPAFKQDQVVSSPEDRYAMTVLATAANPAFYASRFEIDRPGITYTVDTLRALRAAYDDDGSSISSRVPMPLWISSPGTTPRRRRLLLPLLRQRARGMTSTRPACASRARDIPSTCAISRSCACHLVHQHSHTCG